MIKCIACGKSVLLSNGFGNSSLCKNCAAKVNLSVWKNRDVSTIGELTANKKMHYSWLLVMGFQRRL